MNILRFRREKFSVTDGDPIFEVRYIGHREVERAYGHGCTTGVVAALWTRCPYEKCLPKAYLQVGLNGIHLSMPEKPHGRPRIVSHEIKDISYCCVETDVHEKIFAWIHRDADSERDSVHQYSNGGQRTEFLQARGAAADPGGRELNQESPEDVIDMGNDIQRDEADHEVDEVTHAFLRTDSGTDESMHLRCHAVVASKPSRAQTMAATLRRAFHIAYKDWKLDRSRCERSRLVKSLTERDLDLRRCKTDSGIGDFEETGSLSSSTYQPSHSLSDEVESNLSVSSDPK